MQDFLPSTTPARAIQNIDRRLAVIGPLGDGNADEARRLRAARARWAREAEAVRSARIEHHRHLYTTHGEIATEHYQTVVKLLREAHADRQGEGEGIANG